MSSCLKLFVELNPIKSQLNDSRNDFDGPFAQINPLKSLEFFFCFFLLSKLTDGTMRWKETFHQTFIFVTFPYQFVFGMLLATSQCRVVCNNHFRNYVRKLATAARLFSSKVFMKRFMREIFIK